MILLIEIDDKSHRIAVITLLIYIKSVLYSICGMLFYSA